MSNCKEPGCQAKALSVVEYYVTMNHRRVRLWVCALHYLRGQYALNHGPVEVSPPPAVKAAEDAERAHLAAVERSLRLTPRDRDKRSVHLLKSAGFGEAIPGDRVANWRWGEFD